MKYIVACLFLLLVASRGYAESQENDYKGITDPFGDPTQFEFEEEEKEDKEFFHLSRYLLLNLDFGAAIFTGGLGTSISPGFMLGGQIVYFFDRSLALEVGFHRSELMDTIRPSTSQYLNVDTIFMPINLGIRYYFDTRSAPKVIALANPYLCIGGLTAIREQNSVSATGGMPTIAYNVSTSFGAYGGAGLEFKLYKNAVYLGIDLRYLYVSFPDENDTLNNLLAPGSRAGDVVSTIITLTYNF